MIAAIISDTHGYLGEDMMQVLLAPDIDEIWHAGDIGSVALLEKLSSHKKTRAVYGNIDDRNTRQMLPAEEIFSLGKLQFYMVHIGGYPGRYEKGIEEKIQKIKPDIFISGHSHILKIIPDNRYNLLHLNPGAAGRFGAHLVRTMLVLNIAEDRIKDMNIREFDK
jgi:uncharacterized protein